MIIRPGVKCRLTIVAPYIRHLIGIAGGGSIEYNRRRRRGLLAADDHTKLDFTIYLEGHPVHQGNVLARAFLTKAQAILTVLAKMERAYIQSAVRQTDFEIIAADKRNPTTITLSPTAKIKGYDPEPALRWSFGQMTIIGRGGEPDERVKGEIAADLAKLPAKQAEDSYSAFWINGHFEAIKFDEGFAARALAFSKVNDVQDGVVQWHAGVALGTITGELKAVDDVYEDREFIIVPPTGAAIIACKFPASMRDEMHHYLFQMVRVEGLLHYAANSPFPYRVDTKEDGISIYPKENGRKSLAQLRGLFAGFQKPMADWAALIDG